jgi:hypothetical protein
MLFASTRVALWACPVYVCVSSLPKHTNLTEGGLDPFYVNIGVVTLDDTINAILRDEKSQDGADAKELDLDTTIDVDPRIFDSRVSKGSTVTPQEELAVYYHLSGTVPCLGMCVFICVHLCDKGRTVWTRARVCVASY